MSARDSYELNFKILTRIGLWHTRSRNLVKRQLYFFYQSSIIFCVGLFNVLEYADLYVIRDDLGKFNYNLCSTVTTTINLIKTIRNLRVLPEINKLREDLYRDAEKETDEECKTIILKAAKEMRFLNRLFYGMTFSLISCWLSAPLLDYRSGARKLPFRQWFPFDIQSAYNYETAYIYQVVSCFYLASNIIAMDLAAFGFLIQISAEYEILQNIVKKINGIYKEEYGWMDEEKSGMKIASKTNKMIRSAVHHHQQIIT